MIRQGLFWSGLIVIAMAAASVYAAPLLPDDGAFAVRWGGDNTPNGWAGKTAALWLSPGIAAAMTVLLSLLPLLDPRKDNLRRSRDFYLAGWIGGVAVVAGAHFIILYSAVVGAPPPIKYLIVGVSVFLAALGNYMAKTRSNWFAGVRTPWTMESEHAWSVANRFAGFGLVMTGALTILAAIFVSDEAAFLMMTAGVLASIVAATALSYFAWRFERRSGGSAGN